MIRDHLERVIDAVGGSPPLARTVGAVTRHRLRILAYHGIADEERFADQMRHLRRTYRPVAADDVVAALAGARPLPPRAVWVTFDDAEPSVVDRGLPHLERHGIRATLFLCPSVVDTDRPLWWQAVAGAWAAGRRPPPAGRDGGGLPSLLRHLKQMDDATRRSRVAHLSDGLDLRVSQVTRAQLRRFRDTGGTLGNHTWDHPCLDRCDPAAVEAQISRAHRWLTEECGEPPVLFAYPNGNHSETAEAVLGGLGYRVALLFDHRLADPAGPPLRLSRLRVNAEDTPARFRSVLAGVHPVLHALRGGSGA